MKKPNNNKGKFKYLKHGDSEAEGPLAMCLLALNHYRGVALALILTMQHEPIIGVLASIVNKLPFWGVFAL